jgi:hypothetical protein
MHISCLLLFPKSRNVTSLAVRNLLGLRAPTAVATREETPGDDVAALLIGVLEPLSGGARSAQGNARHEQDEGFASPGRGRELLRAIMTPWKLLLLPRPRPLLSKSPSRASSPPTGDS